MILLNIIEKDDFLIFCDSVQPTDAYGKWQVTEYEVPLMMPGIHGDVLIRPWKLYLQQSRRSDSYQKRDRC